MADDAVRNGRGASASDIIAGISAFIAVLALIVGLYAAVITRTVATSGFQSAEHVKSDTATLLAALRSIVVKGAIYTQQPSGTRDDPHRGDYVDLAPEKQVIQGFLTSPTSVAYYTFAANRSRAAIAAGRRDEEWRTFFLRLVQLLYTTNPYVAAREASSIEKMFDTVSYQDFERMASSVHDLPASITTLLADAKYDPVVQALMNAESEQETTENRFPKFVAFLRSKGIHDPNVDLFAATMTGNLNLAKAALHAGADPSTTSGAIIRKYAAFWKEFIKS